MSSKDLHNQIKVIRSISPVAVGTTGTGKTGTAIDRQGFGGLEFIIDVGTITATNATVIPTLLECDTTGGSFTSVADSDMLGTEAAAGVAAAATRTSGVSKNVSGKVGYVGSKRYVKPKIVSTVTAGPPVAATAILHSPSVAPVA